MRGTRCYAKYADLPAVRETPLLVIWRCPDCRLPVYLRYDEWLAKAITIHIRLH